MSEVTSRTPASRGRGSGRGGRGGFAGRGGRRTNGDKPDHSTADSQGAFEDEGDFGELRKQYGDKTSVIREMFPDWSEADVLFALQETNGDENEAVTRIAEGTISQWGEVSKPKKASRAKVKDQAPASSNDATSTGPRATRGGRAVSEGGRGRGRATDRGGRSTRGRSSVVPTNGAGTKDSSALSVPTEESSAWGTKEPKKDTSEENQPIADQPAPSATTEAPKPAAPAVKTWASMLRQSAPPKAPPKPKEAPATPQPAAEHAETESAPEPVEPEAEVVPEPESENVPAPAVDEADETTPVVDTATPTEVPHVNVEPEVALPPSKDELTESNLEQVVDESKPPPTGTVASTTADSWDPRQNPASVTATPISAAQQQHAAPPSGFAATAAKATAERTARTPSHHHHQRRVLDQEEAVRMPGNREVDRAAVQFGAFSLNGDEDIDGDREEPETRAQPPADSPITHPRTSLPPATQAAVPDSFAQKPTSTVAPIAAPTELQLRRRRLRFLAKVLLVLSNTVDLARLVSRRRSEPPRSHWTPSTNRALPLLSLPSTTSLLRLPKRNSLVALSPPHPAITPPTTPRTNPIEIPTTTTASSSASKEDRASRMALRLSSDLSVGMGHLRWITLANTPRVVCTTNPDLAEVPWMLRTAGTVLPTLLHRPSNSNLNSPGSSNSSSQARDLSLSHTASSIPATTTPTTATRTIINTTLDMARADSAHTVRAACMASPTASPPMPPMITAHPLLDLLSLHSIETVVWALVLVIMVVPLQPRLAVSPALVGALSTASMIPSIVEAPLSRLKASRSTAQPSPAMPRLMT
ncbi:rnapii degradation factor def1 [Fusarium oxysporum f. sp. phaseoli]